MNFKVDQKELSKSLNVVVKGIPNNTTNEVLSGILIKTAGSFVELESTDTQYFTKVKLSAQVEADGRAVFPGRLFCDIIKSLDDGAVNIKTDEFKSYISCSNSIFSTAIMDAGDFPRFPEIRADRSVKIDASQFSSLAKQVAKFVSKDDSSGALTGVFFEIGDGKIRATATDGFKLCSAERNLVENAMTEDFSIVVPVHFLNEIVGLGLEEGTITIYENNTQVILELNNMIFINRKLEGNYPDYKEMLTHEDETTIVVEKSEFLAAVKRAALLKSESAPMTIEVDSNNDFVQLAAANAAVGNVREVVRALNYGESLKVTVDMMYVLEGISVINDKKLAISLSAQGKPIYIRGISENINPEPENVIMTPENVFANGAVFSMMPLSL